jgi:hypothetical protein
MPLVLAVTASFGVVGAIVVVRQPRNAVGWILYGAGSATGLSVAGYVYASYPIPQADDVTEPQLRRLS